MSQELPKPRNSSGFLRNEELPDSEDDKEPRCTQERPVGTADTVRKSTGFLHDWEWPDSVEEDDESHAPFQAVVSDGALQGEDLTDVRFRLRRGLEEALATGTLAAALVEATLQAEKQVTRRSSQEAADSISATAKAGAMCAAREAAKRAVVSAVDAVEDIFAERRLAAKTDTAAVEDDKANPFWRQDDCPLRTMDWCLAAAVSDDEEEENVPAWRLRARQLTQKAIGSACVALESPAKIASRQAIMNQRKFAAINLDQVFVSAIAAADVRNYSLDITRIAIESAMQCAVHNTSERASAILLAGRICDRAARVAEARNEQQRQDLVALVAKQQVNECVRHSSDVLSTLRRLASATMSEIAARATCKAMDITEGRLCMCGYVFPSDTIFCRLCGHLRGTVADMDFEEDLRGFQAPESSKQYLIDNRQMQTGTTGLAYRVEKDMRAVCSISARWGSYVRGIDLGDGWLDVGNGKFLPMRCAGFQTISETALESRDLSAYEVGTVYELAHEALLRSYKNGSVLSQLRVEREEMERAEAEARAEAFSQPPLAFENSLSALFQSMSELGIAEDSIASMGVPSMEGAFPVTMARATTCPESALRAHSTSSMNRQESNKRLAVLYGAAADAKLAQKSGSRCSSSATASAGPQGPRASFAPTPPSSGKPRRPPPAHRLPQRRQEQPGEQTPGERQKQEGCHLVNEKLDSKGLRDLDQQKLRRQFLKNLKHSRDQERQKKQTGAVIQEYYWRMRDMEVEKTCRKTEQDWQEREKQRQVDVEQKHADLSQQSDEALSMRYGRIYASPHGPSVQQQRPAAESWRESDVRPSSELEMESMWESEALAVFQTAYNEAVGRFITPIPTDERSPSDLGMAAEEAERASTAGQDRTSRLGCLPQGRVMFESPRNPWRGRQQAGGLVSPIEAVVASLLSGGEEFPQAPRTAPASPRKPNLGNQRPQTHQSSLMRWKQLPPVVPEGSIQHMRP